MERLDKTGATLSIACALHCVLMPLGVGLLGVSGLRWIAHPGVEYSLLLTTVSIAVISLSAGYRHRHGKRRCLGLFVTGLAAIICAHVFAPTEGIEAAGVLGGATLLVTAHLSNAWLCSKCGNCDEGAQP